MEWDKSRVYTALNADELKIGSKVIAANDIEELKTRFENDDCVALCGIRDESYPQRFVVSKYAPSILCYLVSEPEEKILKWTDLKIGDVVKRDNLIAMVTAINLKPDSKTFHISIDGVWFADDELKSWEKVE